MPCCGSKKSGEKKPTGKGGACGTKKGEKKEDK